MNTKIVNGFVWLLVTNKAKEFINQARLTFMCCITITARALSSRMHKSMMHKSADFEIGIEVELFNNLKTN